MIRLSIVLGMTAFAASLGTASLTMGQPASSTPTESAVPAQTTPAPAPAPNDLRGQKKSERRAAKRAARKEKRKGCRSQGRQQNLRGPALKDFVQTCMKAK